MRRLLNALAEIVQENLERWYGQFSRPDGRPSREVAVVTTRTVNGLEVTAVDLAGTYKAGPTTSGPLPPPKRGFHHTRVLIYRCWYAAIAAIIAPRA